MGREPLARACAFHYDIVPGPFCSVHARSFLFTRVALVLGDGGKYDGASEEDSASEEDRYHTLLESLNPDDGYELPSNRLVAFDLVAFDPDEMLPSAPKIATALCARCHCRVRMLSDNAWV